jgi:rhamnosyltransferase
MERRICAIVVTFHPGSDVLGHIAVTSRQVERLIVVDNGSAGHTLEDLRSDSYLHSYVLIENGANLGIACALNVGIRHAIALGYGWVLLLDQDSVLTAGFLEAMLHGVEARQDRDHIAIFIPRYFDRSSGEEMRPDRDRAGKLLVARTSGSLMAAWVFEECGWFVEELVIDQVDYEFSLRVRSRGYGIAECPEAMLLHSLGSPAVHRVFGRRIFGTTNHSAARRYYLARNRTWLLKRYWSAYPRWCAELCVLTLKESLKILVVEDRRWSKLGHTLLGLRDGVAGRMGMTMKL